MAEKEWSRRLRTVFAVWSVVSAMSGTLITAYKFLSAHGNLVPEGAPGIGTLTVLVNACVFTAMLFLYGILVGQLFTYLVGKDKIGPTLVKLACLIYFGVSLAFSHNASLALAGSSVGAWRFLGVMCLLCVVLRLSPFARWASEHEIETIALAGSFLTLAGLIFPSVVHSLWATLSDRQDFSMVPLSSMTFSLWSFAVFGAVIYVWAYFEFQDWRGKRG